MMEIILNKDVLDSVNTNIRSENIVKVFVVKTLNEYLCFKYQEEKDIMISCLCDICFPRFEKNG
ncbi:MAG: hypothetical protein M1542_08305 [Thermotogae bacterium]|nr:hypothetical protein [Thermotogota bacterium]MCL5033229.1 hypothetical protein [Thermotogota bacterium]